MTYLVPARLYENWQSGRKCPGKGVTSGHRSHHNEKEHGLYFAATENGFDGLRAWFKTIKNHEQFLRQWEAFSHQVYNTCGSAKTVKATVALFENIARVAPETWNESTENLPTYSLKRCHASTTIKPDLASYSGSSPQKFLGRWPQQT